MKTTKLFIFLLAGVLLFGACSDNNPEGPVITSTYFSLVINEGNMSDRNGSIDYYDESVDVISRNVLRPALGAMCQSAAISSDGRLWVVANNPDKIVAYAMLSGNTTGLTLTKDLITPRFVDFYGQYMFVTNWGTPVTVGEWSPGYPMYEYQNSYVAVINMSDGSVLKTLPCGADAEGLCIYKDRLFVATKVGVKVFDLSNSTMPEVATIASTNAYAGNAKHFVVDASENLWVAFTGGVLLCFNPTTYEVVKEYSEMPLDSFNASIAISKDGKTIFSNTTDYDESYTMTGTINAIKIADGTHTTLMSGNYNFYSIAVNPFTGYIYTANTEWSANSTMMILDEKGVLQKEKTVGVCTGKFAFVRVDTY